jgi:hypothetical protein
MAGNTKLIGFGLNSTVVLRRWGKQASVTLPPDSIRALQLACANDLPREASFTDDESNYTRIFYEESKNIVAAEFSLSNLVLLHKALNGAMQDASTEEYLTLRTWVSMIESAQEDHKRCIDASNEPGIDDEDPVA